MCSSDLSDAASLLHQSKPPAAERFDVVDLDPYGTAAPFLDGAVQAVAEGGLLMVTCTDLAVLAGTYPEKCYAQYGAFPLKAKYCHEAALRIVLSCIEGHANRHRRYIVPLLSVHINFYVRLFVRVYTGPGEVKKSPSKQSYLYQCSGCESYAMQPVARIDKERTARRTSTDLRRGHRWTSAATSAIACTMWAGPCGALRSTTPPSCRAC